jgi:ABC-type tungstate transport system permease subunit
MRSLAALAGLLVALIVPAAALGQTQIVVQGTTDTRDAGLVDDVIVPGFQAAYPQYTLQYIAVGTGQALTNAKAGQGDAVMTHSAALEADFVNEGYSYEPIGRAVMYNDYVLIGHDADPAGVEAGARHDAVHALELIAQAGEAGNAVFVSRGDNSGTQVQENLMWAQTSGIPLHPVGAAGSGRMEPDGNGDGSGTDVPAWYQKSGVGQAATVKIAEQCNFPPATADACYDLTDRGTFNRQINLGAIAGMKVVSDDNATNARGGTTLLLNQFNVYAVNPAKVPSVKLEGALAFMDYVTSPAFQNALATYPNEQQPAFFPDAFPLITPAGSPPSNILAGESVTASGAMTNRFPGAGPLGSAPVALDASLGIAGSPFGPLNPGFQTIAQGATGANGVYSLSGRPNRSGTLRLSAPRNGPLSPTSVTLGDVHVQAVLNLNDLSATYRRLRLRGSARPSADREDAKLFVFGRPVGRRGGERQLGTLALPDSGAAFNDTVRVPPGRWRVRAEYRDPGAVENSESSPRFSITVPGASKVRLLEIDVLSGNRVRLKGTLSPGARGGSRSRIVLRGRRVGSAGAAQQRKLRVLKRQRLRRGQTRFTITKRLRPGRWRLRTSYVQPGTTDTSNSGIRAVSVR